MRLEKTGILMMVVLAACSRPQILVYEVPKEEPDTGAMSLPSSGEAVAEVDWEAPKGWKELAPAPLRRAGYRLQDAEGTAEITVAAFPGNTGGLAANVNRWRGQLALPPASEEDIHASVRAMPSPAGSFLLVDLKGAGEKTSQATSAAILALAGESWFFKMSGDGTQVEKQKKAFASFLRSVQVHEPAAPQPPAQVPDNGASRLRVSYDTPSGWQVQEPTTMRVTSFRAAGGVDISVVPLGPEAGGEADNLNRWRGQLQLPPLNAGEVAGSLKDLKGAAGTWRVVELVGKANSITGAMLKKGGGTWFVKMTGPSGAVAVQKGAFQHFVQSLRLPGDAP
jgi:hypothetical protein